MSSVGIHVRLRWERQLRFLQARLSPTGYMGLHLTVGMLVIILTCWCFNEIAEGIAAPGRLAALDRHAAELFQKYESPALTLIAKGVSLLGSVAFLAIASLCAAIVFIRKGWFDAVLGIVLTMVGGGLLNTLLKHFFERKRPVFENPLVNLTTFAFPSGHTMGATLFYMFLAAIAAHSLQRRGMRVLAFACAFVMVALIGATRIYLGAHFFTDVLGAVVAGLAWFAFCWTAVETLRKWRKRQWSRAADQEASS
ncbi:MAG: phosphatase PAP2 family protein [Chthoniobacterales bacterium]|nr:phosphatase PAP2 family protein [Chthoniobacterales bacterium]